MNEPDDFLHSRRKLAYGVFEMRRVFVHHGSDIGPRLWIDLRIGAEALLASRLLAWLLPPMTLQGSGCDTEEEGNFFPVVDTRTLIPKDLK